MFTTKKTFFLFITVLLIKLCYVLFINHHFRQSHIIGNYLAIKGNDTQTYIEPIENYLQHDSYGMFMSEFTPFNNKLTQQYYTTIRTPHYGLFYLMFRLLFSSKISFDLLVFLQILVEVFAILAFSKMIFEITKSKTGYYTSLAFLVLSSWITFYAGEMITESFTCSFLMLGFIFYHKWLRDKRNIQLIISGAFIGYAITMKPFLLPYMAIMGISIWIFTKSIINTMRDFILFCLPLFLLLTPWVIRNYINTKEFILFSKPMYYPCKKLVSSCGIFLSAWGGDAIWWEGKCRTAGTFFFPTGSNRECEYVFPSYAYAPEYNLDSLREIRGLIARFEENTANDSLDTYIASRFSKMTQSYKQHNPVQYYLVAPLMRIKSAFIKSGSYYINPTTFPLKLFKIFQTLLYWFPLFFGTIGLIVFGLPKLLEPFNMAIIGFPISLIIVLTVMLKLNEWRYFIHVYPILILFMTKFFLYLKDRFLPLFKEN